MPAPTRWLHLPCLLAALAAATAMAAGPPHAFSAELSAEDFAEHVRVLSSDAFGGRDPATPGEKQTLDYLVAQFRRIGLAPGNGDSYFQAVPMQLRLADLARSEAAVTLGDTARPLSLGTDVVLGSDQGLAEVSLPPSPMVFVGYGIHAPEQGWDGYGSLDVRGKTVVALAGEPTSGQRFDGRRLSFYSRHAYKAEEATRRGAAALLVVHDTAAAGYDWAGVVARWHHREFALRPEHRPAPAIAVQGWLSEAAARDLFASAGADLRSLAKAAARPGFRPVPLGEARLGATLRGRVLRGESMNVVAKLPGRARPHEAVVYLAHWDHLGTVPGDGGDRIYNGALDNASGVAALLEVAEAFARQPQAPERSLVFLLPTLEEVGLLGSRYYTLHPVVPMARTVAALNFDMVVPVGRASDYAVIGLDHSELEDEVRPVVAAQGRVLSAGRPGADDEFLRSDHLSFARAGVPVLYLRGGVETGGSSRHRVPRDQAWVQTASVYHTPDDEFRAEWNLSGIVDDLEIARALGARLADGTQWPNYRQDQAFRAVRDASRASASSD